MGAAVRRAASVRFARIANKKQGVATGVIFGAEASRSICHAADFDIETEFGKLVDQTLGSGLVRPAVEVITAKVAMGRAILEHMVDRGEQRSNDRADRFQRGRGGSSAVGIARQSSWSWPGRPPGRTAPGSS